MNSRQLLYSLAFLIAAGLVAAVMMYFKPEPIEDERVEQVPLVEAVAFEAASGPIPVLGSGIVQARDEVTIGAQISGRLTYVHPAFRQGGTVPKGATLLRIDQSDYRNQVRAAEADVAAQDVAVLEAEQEVAIAREELQRFANRETQQAKGAQTRSATQILPPRTMAAAPQSAGAQADQKQAQPASIQPQGGLATREPQLRSAKAARERAEASLADAKLLLGRTAIASPFTGLVREESAAVGALVQPGEALGSIVSTAAYEVRISLTADEAAMIPGLLSGAKGRIAAQVMYDYGGRTYRWPAFVDRANAILDSATRNIEVFLRVPSPLTAGRLVDAGDDPEGAPPLLLGAFVQAEITGASLERYAAVPAEAVRPGNEVWIVRDGKLAIVPVRVIQRSDEIAYISTPSLDQGGDIVTSSLTAPIEGMQVRVAGGAAE